MLGQVGAEAERFRANLTHIIFVCMELLIVLLKHSRGLKVELAGVAREV
jgi:hypothetical protein